MTPNISPAPLDFIRAKYGDTFQGCLSLWSKQTRLTQYFPAHELDRFAETVDQLSESEDVYVALSLQAEPLDGSRRGSADGVIALPGFVADIDFSSAKGTKKAYPSDLDEALKILRSFAHQPTWIIETGKGLHVHWDLSAPYFTALPEQRVQAARIWTAFQRLLIAHFRKYNRAIDSVGDLVRNYRLPGTLNHKLHPPRLVTVLQHNPENRYSLDNIRSSLAEFFDPVVHPSNPDLRNLPADHSAIVAGCAWYRETVVGGASTCDEPNWYAGASITSRCDDGEEIFLAYSRSHPRFAEREARAKFRRALAEAGPRTCKSIEFDLGHEACQDCPLHGEITSPIQLGDRPVASGGKPKVAEVCMKLAIDAGAAFFHDEQKQAYISVPQESGARLNYPLQSEDSRHWLRYLYYSNTGRSLAQQSLKEALDTLESRALYASPQEVVQLRVGGNEKAVFIDLGHKHGRVVHITGGGWSTTNDCAFNFYRPPGIAALPEPECGGELASFRQLLSLSDENWIYLLAFLLNVLKPKGPYMCLLVEGEQGSGKSLLCLLIKRLLDPHSVEKLRLPKSEHDLMIQAREHAVLVFDNASGVKWDISDALCSLATGGGFSTRKYYTDNESRSFNFTRPFIINGIGEFADRPDLLERAIPLRLTAMPSQGRKTEREILASFEAMRPRLLGCLYDIVAHALDRFDQVEAPTTIRMADTAQWLCAAEPATGLPEGSFLRALEAGQTDMMLERVINDPVVMALLTLTAEKPFEGLMAELHADLMSITSDKQFPPTPAHLSRVLKRLNPAISKLGLRVQFGAKVQKGKTISVYLEHSDFTPIKPSFRRF